MTGNHGQFVWCDLSTFHPKRTMGFYSDLFGWAYDGDAESHANAFIDKSPVAGIYRMPERFAQINMPSFWMSYIQVTSVPDAIDIATSMGARVELQEDYKADGRIALIRDPLGAGFTIYEGEQHQSIPDRLAHGHRFGHILCLSDVAAVRPFYEALFDWCFVETSTPARWLVQTADGHLCAEAQTLPDEVRGGFEYWGIVFTVSDAEKVCRAVTDGGGQNFGPIQAEFGTAHSMTDPDGAAFFVARPV